MRRTPYTELTVGEQEQILRGAPLRCRFCSHCVNLPDDRGKIHEYVVNLEDWESASVAEALRWLIEAYPPCQHPAVRTGVDHGDRDSSAAIVFTEYGHSFKVDRRELEQESDKELRVRLMQHYRQLHFGD